MQVDVASPLGGIIPVDPLSMKELIRTPDDDRLLGDDAFRQKLMRSLPIADLDFAAYDIIYFAGGWGAAFDLGQSELLGRKVSEAHAATRVIGGICHGPLGLLKARTANGDLLVKGRRLTAVTDKQIHELGVGITPLTRVGPPRRGRLVRGQAPSGTGFLRESLRRRRGPHHRPEPERGTDGRAIDDAARRREPAPGAASGVMKLPRELDAASA